MSPSIDLPDDGEVEVIVDRLVRGKDPPERRLDSIETAFAKGLGRCRVMAGDESQTYVAAGGAADAGRITSSPSRTCFATTAPSGPARSARVSGGRSELDLGRIVPDPSKTIRSGARRAVATPAYRQASSRSCSPLLADRWISRSTSRSNA